MTEEARPKLWHHLVAVGIWLLIVAAGFWLIGEVVDDGSTTPSAPVPSGELAEPIQKPTGAQLMVEHGCWTMRDGAPGNVDGIPGGVVVRVDGGDPEYTTNALAIGMALDAALDGAENGVEAIAFCRGDW